MRRTLASLGMAAAIASAVLVGEGVAVESSTVGSQTNQANVDVLNSKIDSVIAAMQTTINNLQTTVNNFQACQNLGDFYTPGHAGANAQGCWSNSTSTAAGTITAFNGTTCPSGWSEYTAARGKFLRGIDNGAGYDPEGTRAPGSYQADKVGPHTHNVNEYPAAWQNSASSYKTWGGAGGVMTFTTDTGTTGPETRPRNIAILFCVKN